MIHKAANTFLEAQILWFIKQIESLSGFQKSLLKTLRYP